jgi:hypothetical protein
MSTLLLVATITGTYDVIPISLAPLMPGINMVVGVSVPIYRLTAVLTNPSVPKPNALSGEFDDPLLLTGILLEYHYGRHREDGLGSMDKFIWICLQYGHLVFTK